jgi:hypothetical protein
MEQIQINSEPVVFTNTMSSMNCIGEDHLFIFSGHNLVEGTKCLCGKKKYHYETCPTCKQAQGVYLDVKE